MVPSMCKEIMAFTSWTPQNVGIAFSKFDRDEMAPVMAASLWIKGINTEMLKESLKDLPSTCSLTDAFKTAEHVSIIALRYGNVRGPSFVLLNVLVSNFG